MGRKRTPTAAPVDRRALGLGICGGLVLAIWLVFGQTLHHDFVNFDDDVYVVDNRAVAPGLTSRGIAWAFTHTHADNWHPLTWVSHMLDCDLYGLDPGGHHLTNVLLHATGSVLLFLVLWHMTAALWQSAFVAAVFAVHPLRVESVAWVSERKDVLSGVFFMLTLGAYLHYARRPSSRARYLAVAVLFAAGLACKPMLVTLPVVLLLLDYWPLGRFSNPRRVVMEKVPLLGMAAAACLVTIAAQRDAIQPLDALPFAARVTNAVVAYAAYLGDMAYPACLAVFRPYRPHAATTTALALALLASISIATIRLRRDRPYLLVGWLWYVVMLAPAIGIVQVGTQARADRYTYLPQIGLSLLVTWAAADACRSFRHRRVALGVVAAVVVALLAARARSQTSYWQSSETLWTHALACTSDNAIAHSNLGAALLQSGRAQQAIVHLEQALEIAPDYRQAHTNLGNALLRTGRATEAFAHYRRAQEIDPGDANASYNLGNALLEAGRADEAIVQYQQAVRIDPDFAKAHNNLASALLRGGRVDEAIGHLRKALEIDPTFAFAHNNIGHALLQTGAVEEAMAQYQQAVQLDPTYAEAHYNLGLALFRTGRIDDAMREYRTALALAPDYPEAHNNLAIACLEKGRVDEAIAHYRKALEGDPQSVAVLDNLAWTLATGPEASFRNGAEAVALAERAVRLSGGADPLTSRTLAAAYAEAGRFDDAIRAARKAIELAETGGQATLANQVRAQLKLYRDRRPFHEMPRAP